MSELQEFIRTHFYSAAGRLLQEKNILKSYPDALNRVKASTAGLPEEATLKERLLCLETGATERPACRVCGSPTPFQSASKSYSRCCSVKCAANDPERLTKIEVARLQPGEQERRTAVQLQTVSERYGEGIRSTSQLPDVRAKQVATVEERYGVANPMQDPAIRAKQVASTVQTCGVGYALQSSEVRERVKQTCLVTYGVSNPAKSEACKAKARQTSFINNGFAHALQSPEIMERKRITCQARYGVNNTLSSLVFRTKAQTTCLARYGARHALQFSELLRKANQTRYGQDTAVLQTTLDLFANLEWMKDQHLTQQKTFQQIAEENSVSGTFVSTHYKLAGIEAQNFAQSRAEKDIGDFIRSLGFEIQTGNRQLIRPQELDIYIPSKSLAIEYCGLYWHSDLFKHSSYHKDKLGQCIDKGVRLLTIFEDEWIHRPEIVKAKLKSILGCSDTPTVGARKCRVIQVSSQAKKEFLDQNHIQGDGPGSITYGLEHQGQLVACMTFIEERESRFNLNRYATSCRIPGGFSKLMKHFQQQHQWNQIKSFADLRWSTGDLYSQSGFELDGLVAPDYQYVVGDLRIHKFNFRHTSGLKKLPNYDPTKTESQLMDEAGYLRIYNCGLQRWVLRNPDHSQGILNPGVSR